MTLTSLWKSSGAPDSEAVGQEETGGRLEVGHEPQGAACLPHSCGHAPLPELPVLQLQAAMQRLQAAVLADEGLVLRRLVLMQGAQVLVVLQQRLVRCRQPLLLFLQVLVLALLGRLLVLEQCVLCREGGTLRAERGILHLQAGRRPWLPGPRAGPRAPQTRVPRCREGPGAGQGQTLK